MRKLKSAAEQKEDLNASGKLMGNFEMGDGQNKFL
jgi:hypothetical protein